MARGGGVQEAQIQWYPGHMATAMRKVGERLKIVDVVIEVLDARVPRSSANPALDRIAAPKPRLVVLGREDLADPHATREWVEWNERNGRTAIPVNGLKWPSAGIDANRIFIGLRLSLEYDYSELVSIRCLQLLRRGPTERSSLDAEWFGPRTTCSPFTGTSAPPSPR